MDTNSFMLLLKMISPVIEKKDTNFRRAISAGDRLSITLRHLATGETLRSLSSKFSMSSNGIGGIVTETCNSISQYLKSSFLETPQSGDDWKDIAQGFQDKCNFPNCLGAIEGKQILMKYPLIRVGSSSKSTSIILIVLVDHEYNFKYFYIDSVQGDDGEIGIWKRCPLEGIINNSNPNMPESRPLPGRKESMPYVAVANEFFALKSYLLKPFPKNPTDQQTVYNNRLSRVHQVAETAFGILSASWGIYKSPIESASKYAKLEALVSTTILLHNFLIKKSKNYIPQDLRNLSSPDAEHLNEDWRTLPTNISPLVDSKSILVDPQGKKIRNEFCEYFNCEGRECE